METTETIETVATFGQRPSGTARGDERWSKITADDGVWRVTGFRGWCIDSEATFSGRNAAKYARAHAQAIV